MELKVFIFSPESKSNHNHKTVSTQINKKTKQQHCPLHMHQGKLHYSHCNAEEGNEQIFKRQLSLECKNVEKGSLEFMKQTFY